MNDNVMTILVIGVLAVLLIGMAIYGARLTGLLATLMSPEDAKQLYQSGVQFGLELALNQAQQTETPIDNRFFEGLARKQGYEVIKHDDGHYEVKMTPTTTVTLSAPSSSFAITSTHDLSSPNTDAPHAG